MKHNFQYMLASLLYAFSSNNFEPSCCKIFYFNLFTFEQSMCINKTGYSLKPLVRKLTSMGKI